MVTAVIVIALLTIAASLASWLFSQWLARRSRISSGALAAGGIGAVLLIGAAALAVVTASSSWPRLLPAADSSQAAENPGASVIPDWPASACVVANRAEASSRWILDNNCDGVVAVLFASCASGERACSADTQAPPGGWRYEPAGILMTRVNDKPVPLRLGDDGPLIAPIFTIRDVAGVPRQIGYLACEVTAPRVLQLLARLGGIEPTLQELTAELRSDACYSQVLDWTRSGQRQGQPPEVLLRENRSVARNQE